MPLVTSLFLLALPAAIAAAALVRYLLGGKRER
jgi:hypothetical protein